MTPGCRTWRAAPGLVALSIATLAGCHSVPVAKLAPTPNRPQTTIAEAGRAALLPATVALDTPSEMAAMEPVRPEQPTEPAPRMAPASSPVVIVKTEEPGDAPVPSPRPIPAPSPPAETPLLDAALERARGIEGALVEEMTPPEQAPLPPARPEPIVVPPVPEPAKPEPSPEPKPEPEPAPPRPEDQWREGVRRLIGLAHAQAGRPDDATIPWDLRARVLAWMAGPDIDPEVDRPESRDVRAVLKAMADAPSGPPANADDVRAAIRVLEERAPLEISDLQLCTRVDGFGDYQALDPPIQRPGQQVVIYCKIDGVRHEATGNGYRSRLAAQVEVVPEGGGTPAWAGSLGTGEETCRYRRNDYFINYMYTIPRTLPAGRYALRLTEKDLVSGRSASREVPLAIVRD